MTLADQLLSEGRQEGIQEGIEKGIEKGALIGKVQMLQQLLGRTVDPTSAFAGSQREQLEAMIARLQRELGERSR